MRIVVVGGVATGMSAAARARRLDESAEIIVLEKGPYVSFANCGLPYYVGGEIEDRTKLLVQTPESLREALNLDVRVDTEVVAMDAVAKTVTVRSVGETSTIRYDSLVLAPGAEAVRPPIPGLDSPRVMTLRSVDDALAMKEFVDSSAKQAVVLGAGFIGLEAAEALRHQGLDVSVVELAPHVLPPLEPELATYVKDALLSLGIDVRDGIGATEIRSDQHVDRVVLSDGTVLDADLVALSTGVRPATAPFEAAGVECFRGAMLVDSHGRTSLEDVWAGGDAVAMRPKNGLIPRVVPLAGPANRAGRLIADSILLGERAREIPVPLSTAVVRVGDQTAALTGANRQMLDADGREYETINLHPFQHATYFPGAKQMHLIVHFDPENGEILGAQGVGEEGVDKRIDVFATAIRGGLTISDLVDLDLTYAPPYGSAKDAVNMAGMLGENVLGGVTRLWHAEDLPTEMERALILDARSRTEYASGHVPGALNIPHTEIRERIDEISQEAAGRPIRVHCASGVRSYLSERMLRAAGFDVKNMTGGMITMKQVIAAGMLPGLELVEGEDRG
ncbi:FAD-dependent oxidoreductase [Actinomycetaceae bacterium MB13-C1-2]|nr:FAD-dependent oxidoreductase [Actinomycetaceae bacterium MB13-C1-2]